MEFQQSDVLKQLPTQFFASLVQKVQKKVQEGADIINLGQEILTSQLPRTL